MANLGGFDARNHEKMREGGAIAPGWVVAHIVKSEKKKNSSSAKDPNGKQLALQFKIVEGKHKGRVFFANLNLWNKNPDAVSIAQSELTSICMACRNPTPEDSVELHKIPIRVKLGIQKATAKWPEKNIVEAYEPYDGPVENLDVDTSEVSGNGPDHDPVEGKVEPRTSAKPPWLEDE